MGHVHLFQGRRRNRKAFRWFQRISIYFWGLGVLRSKAKPKRIHDAGELLSFTVRANGKELTSERLMALLVALPHKGSDEIGEKFLHDTHTDIAAHGDAEADGGVARGMLAWRKPGPCQERSRRNPTDLGDGKLACSIVMARQDAAAQGITCARPKTLFAGAEVTIVLVKCTA